MEDGLSKSDQIEEQSYGLAKFQYLLGNHGTTRLRRYVTEYKRIKVCVWTRICELNSRCFVTRPALSSSSVEMLITTWARIEQNGRQRLRALDNNNENVRKCIDNISYSISDSRQLGVLYK